VGDRGDLDRHVEGLERHVTVALAERRFGLEYVAVDQALDHDLGIRWHIEIDGAAARHADRLAGCSAGDPFYAGMRFLRDLRWTEREDTGLVTKLRAAGLMTRDPRAVERKKPGRAGARKRFQFSKR